MLGRGRRNDDQRAHQQHSQEAKAQGHGDGERQQEEQVHPGDVDARGACEVGRNQGNHQAALRPPDREDHQGGGGETEQGFGAAGGLGAAEEGLHQLLARGQHAADRQRGGEHHANDRVGRQMGRALQRPDQQRPGEQRGQPTEQRIQVEEERDPHSGQGYVRNGIGRQGHPAHDRDGAHQSGGHRHAERQDQLAKRGHDGGGTASDGRTPPAVVPVSGSRVARRSSCGGGRGRGLRWRTRTPG